MSISICHPNLLFFFHLVGCSSWLLIVLSSSKSGIASQSTLTVVAHHLLFQAPTLGTNDIHIVVCPSHPYQQHMANTHEFNHPPAYQGMAFLVATNKHTCHSHPLSPLSQVAALLQLPVSSLQFPNFSCQAFLPCQLK